MFHVVKGGDYFFKIAKQYGFVYWKMLWNDPGNAELKKKLKNLNVRSPDSTLFAPEKESKCESRSTEHYHQFRLTQPESWQRFEVRNLRDCDRATLGKKSQRHEPTERGGPSQIDQETRLSARGKNSCAHKALGQV